MWLRRGLLTCLQSCLLSCVLAALVPAGILLAPAAWAASPQERNVQVEFRQITEADLSGAKSYGAGSDSEVAAWEPQMLLLRNGEKASLKLIDSVPMHWQQTIQAPQSGTGVASTGNAGAGGGLTQGVAWFDAGQSMTVQVQVKPGSPTARLQIEVQRADLGQRSGPDLPRQIRASLSTSVELPLAQWVSLASSGAATGLAGSAGVYKSESSTHRQRILQVRVMLP